MERAAILAWRRERRVELIAARLALPAAAHHAASAAITLALGPLLAPQAGVRIGFYWPFRREFNPLPAIESHLAAGGRAALPVVVGKGRPLEFRDWRPGAAMANGVYDIPYPAEGPPVAPDLLLVAMVGFDGARYRLGYGGGFYDRTLAASAPRPRTIGVCFELGRLATIHPLPHDIPMDLVVTEAGVVGGAARAGGGK